MTRYRFRCEVLSPIHIGSGSEMEPLNYMVRANRLSSIAMDRFVGALGDDLRAHFEALIDAGDLAGIRRFVFEHANVENHADYTVEVSDGVAGLYRSRLKDIQNQLLISPFIRSRGAAYPFIPGSSIKGAIRSALVSAGAGRSNIPKPANAKEEREFESKVFGCRDPKDDPLRGIRVRDTALGADSTVIREVRNASKKEGEPLALNSIQIICEVTHSRLTGQPLSFDTEISFDDLLFSTGFLRKSFAPRDIGSACNEFYGPKMQDEHYRFYKGSFAESCSTELLNYELDGGSFRLRVGRFSGVESVTIDGYRNPRPPGKKNLWGTSRNLAEGKYPMGWLKVTLIE